MNLENALGLYSRIEKDPASRSIFSRANARYILFGVNEPRENFPGTLEYNLDLGSDSLAFSYLSIGCTLFENGLFNSTTRASLEKGAEFIEFNHLHLINRNVSSNYYLLISGLAYYAAGQYSKSFIVIKEASDYQTDVSKLCSSFLKKNLHEVQDLLNQILIGEQDYLNASGVDEIVMDQRRQVVIFAKAIASLLNYLYTGNEESLAIASEILTDLMELLQLEEEPSMWWVVRLFKIITKGFGENSLWATIPPKFKNKRNKKVARKYVCNLIFGRKTILELFKAQKDALAKVLGKKGAVISLPTSSGKTQIASLAILKTLLKYPNSKILYLAPYRSLAFEVEMTFKETFEGLGYNVSQLYGTGQFTKLDKLIVSEANILIATPEKAKVILRANDDVVDQIKLIVIDEGHLLDESQRNVTNELFVEELKIHTTRNRGKIILLSAVLPNSAEIAQWICEDKTACVIGKQRLARQRLGILDFKNNSVKLEWFGEEKSYNPNFIRPIPPARKNWNIQPADKAVAVALTALRLSDNNKSLLLFTARAVSVNTYAKALKKALKLIGQAGQLHQWSSKRDWDELQLVCKEYDSDENKEIIEYASYGVLCHKGGLNKEIRASLEKLMRNGNPRIIVATMTLGQGVNLGVSTVIIADVNFYDRAKKSWESLKSSEVWNIIGRAGRAFQDIEGKILFASETQNENDLAKQYIENEPQNTYSGLLIQIRRIKRIAASCNIKFDVLLELIAENNFSDFNTWTLDKTQRNVKLEFEDVLDWIDDSLLSINLLFDGDDVNLDAHLRGTLAFIQAENFNGISQENVIDFLLARNRALKEKIVPNKYEWKSLSTSSLPLASAIKLNQVLDKIIVLTNEFIENGHTFEDRLGLLKKVEGIIHQLPSKTFQPELDDNGDLKYPEQLLDEARKAWLSGHPLKGENIKKITKLGNSYFGYKVTWVLGAIANKLKEFELEEHSAIFEELAICCELGLPDLLSSKIYLSGIRSRIASRELSETLDFFLVDQFLSLFEIRTFIIDNLENLANEVSNEITKEWLKTIERIHNDVGQARVRSFSDFTLQKEAQSSKLFVKQLQSGEIFLCSADYSDAIAVEATKELPFQNLANKANYYFVKKNNVWKFRSL